MNFATEHVRGSRCNWRGETACVPVEGGEGRFREWGRQPVGGMERGSAACIEPLWAQMWVKRASAQQRSILQIQQRVIVFFFSFHFLWQGPSDHSPLSLPASLLGFQRQPTEEGNSGLAHSASKAGPPRLTWGGFWWLRQGASSHFSRGLQGQPAHSYISVRMVELILLNNSKLIFKEIILFIFN